MTPVTSMKLPLQGLTLLRLLPAASVTSVNTDIAGAQQRGG